MLPEIPGNEIYSYHDTHTHRFCIRQNFIFQYTFMANDLVGIVASTPAPPNAKSRKLQLSLLISAYTAINSWRYGQGTQRL